MSAARLHRLLICVGSLLLTPADAIAGESSQEGKNGEPRPEQILREVDEYLAGLNTFGFELAQVTNLPSIRSERLDLSKLPGEPTETLALSVVVERPNKLRLEQDPEAPQVGFVIDSPRIPTVVSSGEKLYVYSPSSGEYVVEKAPETLGDLVMPQVGPERLIVSEAFAAINVNMKVGRIMRALLLPHGFALGFERFKGEYVGVTQFGGATCHHLRFSSDAQKWDLWVETGDRPVVRQAVVTPSEEFFAAMGLEDSDLTFRDVTFDFGGFNTVISLSNWATNIDIPSEKFEFTPPESAEKVEELFSGEIRLSSPGKPE